MKSPKFMGKERVMDLTSHTLSPPTHTHTIAMGPTTIEPKQSCGLTPFLTELKAGLLLLILLVFSRTVVLNYYYQNKVHEDGPSPRGSPTHTPQKRGRVGRTRACQPLTVVQEVTSM